MYTTCPRCETQLTVTVAGLRSGQGFVRCSRCSEVFNALPQLADDGEGTDIANATGSRPTLPEAPEAQEPWPLEEQAESEHVSTGTFQTIVLEGDAVMETEEIVPETELDAQIKDITEQIEASQEPESTEHPTFDLDEGELDRHALEHAVPPTDKMPPLPEPETAGAAVAQVSAEPDPVALLGRRTAATGRRRWLWLLCGLLALLVAAGALVHRYRQDLLEIPWAARPLASVYGLLRLPLEPRWDVAAYEVRLLGVDVAESTEGAPPSRITVHAGVHNHAPRSQPAPMLRVALEDRFGRQLTTRVVAPEEYLRDSPHGTLGADQRVDVSFTLPDPGQGAVGFEIDACLRDAGGTPRCSNDPPAH